MKRRWSIGVAVAIAVAVAAALAGQVPPVSAQRAAAPVQVTLALKADGVALHVDAGVVRLQLEM